MTSTSSTQHTSVPAPRGVPKRLLDAIEHATGVLYELVEELDQTTVRGPSLLPGWTRAHVITHLARNADALVNLLTWARTGVEHQAYASRADRDADIEEGAGRLMQLLRADLDSACTRFIRACRDLPHSAWQAEVATPGGQPIKADGVPWLRLRELWIHMVDLNHGITFDDLPPEWVEEFVADSIERFDGRGPSVTIEATLPGGRQRSWTLNGPASTSVIGSGADVLGWLTGRTDGAGLRGDVPDLPAWG
ncbi:maleylpyruvate isomerase family mycothiol-dependent enzyme [Lentzea sp. NBRC 105346]|uniref:maleylpyruvate isomerase family mycothiol-dependent enzyme n=1 Tax=Lentzea sp. NBRC 105346 TaxID=3032205 RepID=UPI00255597D1|nr:maleylpyruvate isomerase family mycothiol-dependent enzyme [Lentzea sp. NBRC 105346]